MAVYLYGLLMNPVFGQDNIFPLDTGYHRPWDFPGVLMKAVERNQEIASWEVIGFSGTDHLPIYVVKISDNVEIEEPGEPNVLICGPCQAEEAVGLEIVLGLIDYCISHYGTDPDIRRWVMNHQLRFVIHSNPEGMQWVNGGRWPLKRKNNTDTNWDGYFDYKTDGVDLNKNYPIHWEEDTGTNPASPYFKGDAAASEAEVFAMIRFTDRLRPVMSLNYHSSATGNYSERIFFPWLWVGEYSADWNGMRNLAWEFAQLLPRDYEEGIFGVHEAENNSRGYFRDFLYAYWNTWAYDIETCGNTVMGYSVIHPPNSQLERIIAKHTDAWFTAMKGFEKRLISVRVTDERGKAVPGVTIVADSRIHPTRTDQEGWVFFLRDKPPVDILTEGLSVVRTTRITAQHIVITVSTNDARRHRDRLRTVDRSRESLRAIHRDFSRLDPFYLAPQAKIGIEPTPATKNNRYLKKIVIHGHAESAGNRIRLLIRNLRTGKVVSKRKVLFGEDRDSHTYLFDDVLLPDRYRVELENLGPGQIDIYRFQEGIILPTEVNKVLTSDWVTDYGADFGMEVMSGEKKE